MPGVRVALERALLLKQLRFLDAPAYAFLVPSFFGQPPRVQTESSLGNIMAAAAAASHVYALERRLSTRLVLQFRLPTSWPGLDMKSALSLDNQLAFLHASASTLLLHGQYDRQPPI